MPPFGVTPTGFVDKTLEEIKAEIEAAELAQISPTLNVSAASVIGQLNGIFASKLREVWEVALAAYNASYPDGASDASLDNVAAITGTVRNPATKSTVTLTVNLNGGTTLSAGAIAAVAGDTSIQFATTEDVVAPAGPAANYPAPAEATVTGPVSANAGTLTVIVTPAAGWNSVTNAADAVEGADIESDADLRARREAELQAAGSSTLDAIRADLLQLLSDNDITEGRVFARENVTDATDVDGLPPHSFEIVIFDGLTPQLTNDQIAQAIWDTKPSGIQSYGLASGTATDSEGLPHVLGFTRVTVKNVWLEFDLDVDADTYGGDAAVKTAVATYGDENYDIGDDVILAALNVAVFGVPGVLDVTAIRAGFAVSPVGTVNLAIGARELADLDTARVVVNS